MKKAYLFPCFLGPIITLLPTLFVSTQGEGASGVSFVLLTVCALLATYVFGRQGLIGSALFLTGATYYLDIQMVWTAGVWVALTSGLVVSTVSWQLLKDFLAHHEDAELATFKSLLMATREQLQKETREKNQLKQDLLSVQSQPTSVQPVISKTSSEELGSLKKLLDQKAEDVRSLQEQLTQVKEQYASLVEVSSEKPKEQEDRLALDQKIEEQDKLIQLLQQEEKRLLNLLKEESQLQTSNE